MKRKLLSVLLTFCLAFSLLPTAALAEGETAVAKVGDVEYPTLAKAVAAAKEAAKTDEIHSATITLLKNTELAAEVTLDGYDSVDNEYPLDISIDLNNRTLDMKGFSFTIENGAVLEIFDGQIDSTLEIKTMAAFYVNAKSSCLLDNVTMKTTGVAVFARGDCALAAVNNSNITAGTYAVGTNASSSDNYNPVFKIVGSTLKGLSPVLVNVPCELNIKNSTINGSMHGVIVRGGTANITGSTITQTYTNDDYQTMADYFNNCNWGTGNMINLGALIVGNKHATSYQYPSDVTVTDTVIKTAGAHADLFPAIYTYANNAADKEGVNLSIGGDKTNVSGKVVKGNEEYNTISISGGAFTDLANAVKYAADGATIKLAGDVSGSGIGAIVTKKLTLDLNGHSIKRIKETSDSNAVYPALYVNGGNLTLIDTSAAKTGAVKSVITATTGASPYNAVSSAVYVNGGTFTLKSGALSTDVKNDKDQSQGVVVCQNSKFIMEDGSITAESDSGNAFGVVVFTGSEFTLNNGTITSTGMGISGNGSSGEGNTTININGGSVTGQSTGIYQPQEGALNITAGEIKGCTGIEAKSGNVKIEITGTPTITATGEVKHTPSGNGNSTSGYAIAAVENNAYSGKANVSIANGFYNGEVKILKDNEVDAGKTATITITGGLFSSDPSAYVADDHHVDASNNGDYPYTVKEGTKPAGALIVVKDATDVMVPDSEAIKDLTTEDKTNISQNTKVDGVAEAVAAKKDDLIPKSVDTSAATKVEVEVSVKVEVKSADLSGENAAKTLTFEAKPVATIKVDGTVKATDVAVPNSLLSGDITVKLPLPEGFTPKQIKHTSADGSVEYFLKTPKTGAKTFEIKDGCAVFTITKFSTFELSGKVTYVAPSYSGGSSDPTYSVSTPSKTEHGSVTVSPKSASKGDRVTVTVKPDSGYVLETLTVTDRNGNELSLKDKGNGKYTFTMPAGKVEVKATFMEDNSMLNFFYDVPNNAYFYEAVKWAVKNGITTGVGNDLFAPEQPCTRAQIVTFLWRAAGSPEPKGAASGMTDVVSGSYYEKAVAWAIENGITTGTTTSTFSPDATCTRAQAVTFLARALKAKAASAAEFSDVPTDSYFADAVAWAAANGVTEGIGGGLFGSDNDCTRGQIVTFLYRAYNK